MKYSKVWKRMAKRNLKKKKSKQKCVKNWVKLPISKPKTNSNWVKMANHNLARAKIMAHTEMKTITGRSMEMRIPSSVLKEATL